MSVIRTRTKEYYIMEHYPDEERIKHVNKGDIIRKSKKSYVSIHIKLL